MPKQPSEFVEYVIGSLAMLGPVRAKSMFGGWGIFCDDLMFGLVADDELYLKVDTQNQPDFEAEGSEAFVFEMKNGRSGTMSYFSAPSQCYDDNEAMLEWGQSALAAALRQRKPKKAAKKKPKTAAKKPAAKKTTRPRNSSG